MRHKWVIRNGLGVDAKEGRDGRDPLALVRRRYSIFYFSPFLSILLTSFTRLYLNGFMYALQKRIAPLAGFRNFFPRRMMYYVVSKHEERRDSSSSIKREEWDSL